MLKKLFDLLLILFLPLAFLYYGSTTYAIGAIVFGPVELEAANIAGDDLEVTVQTTNPNQTYTFNIGTNNGCSQARGKTGPCLREQSLDAATSGTTHIEITDIKRKTNNIVNDDGTFELVKPSQTVWDLKDGGATGWITYSWKPKSYPPATIAITPKQVKTTESAKVAVTLPDRKALLYRITLTPTPRNASIGPSLEVDCNNSDACTTRGRNSAELFQNVALTGNKNLTFDIAANILVEGTVYRVTVDGTIDGRFSVNSIYDTFIVQNKVNNLNVQISPNTLEESQTKSHPIEVTLVDGTSESYQIRPLTTQLSGTIFTCSGQGCHTTINTGSVGLTPGEYLVTVVNRNNSGITGSATLTITGSKSNTGPVTSTPRLGIVSPTYGGGTICDSDSKNPGVKTAIGCIHTNPLSFITDLFKFFVAIAGGMAFFLMLLGAFGMVTSQGNPQTLSNARERFSSALIGLLFIIFAVLLMQIIGVNILALPDFQTGK